MKVKIFNNPVNENEVNEFISNHIILKEMWSASGSAYYVYRELGALERDPIFDIEELQRAFNMANKDILSAEISMIECNMKISDLKQEQSKYEVSDKEWDKIQKTIEQVQNENKLNEVTIAGRKIQILAIKEKYANLLNEINK